jgi:hypothetical protein
MSRIVWGDPGNRTYETGVDRGVFYPQGSTGVPWNGLVAVSETPSGADIRKSHYDGEPFNQQRTSESFAAKISAVTYPREFSEYDGLSTVGHAQQARKMFGLSYRTLVVDGSGNSYSLIHLVYNALASPSQTNFKSLAGGIEVNAFEWDLNTIPEFLPDGSFSAHVVVNPKIAYPWATDALENILYGTDTFEPRMPSILEVVNLFENASLLRITDNGDGTWTADGPDEAFNIVGDYFEITWPSAVWIDTTEYKISSL